MNAERRRALEKELQDILEITNPLVPATLDPNCPTAMGVAEVVRRHAVRSRMREVGFETRFRNAHYYFCLKPGRQGAGGTQPIKEISAQVYRRDHPALFETI
jgi:hypothetical protein